jgi:asparagine synthase (glutamine-hydrolysing)
MSGIVGLLNTDGSPADRALLRQMTDALRFRGPDAQQVWIQGNIGLGHALLRTTAEAKSEQQPFSLDGQVWIVADARVDARDDLVAALAPADSGNLSALLDVELILRAYECWGERCVEHLIGDFAFAIWDARRRRLFCARDQVGPKPFFYSVTPGRLVFSNTLDCVRLDPAVSGDLDDRALADFLVFESNQDLTTTSFAQIRRLPAAHTLVWQDVRLEVKRYWQLPQVDELHYRHPGEYVEQFRELLGRAVRDRVRGGRAAILMSGGVDSTTVAACARDLAPLRAYTVVDGSADPEPRYAGLAAESLGIPIAFFHCDGYSPYARWPELRRPEPVHDPLSRASTFDLLREISRHSRVVLTGEGGDPAFAMSAQYLTARLKRLQFARLFAEVGGYVAAHRRLPVIGLRSAIKQRLGLAHAWVPPFPAWLQPELVSRLRLRERWRALTEDGPARHPLRSSAYRILAYPGWERCFEQDDPGVTGVAVESRHPLCDLRVLQFLLALPPLPWILNKELLRASTRGLLPDTVRLRPKATVPDARIREQLQSPDSRWMDSFVAVPELARFVERAAVRSLDSLPTGFDVLLHTRPLSLNYWLHQTADVGYKTAQESGVVHED